MVFFVVVFVYPFVTSDVSDVQNCGRTQIFHVAEQPFHHFGRVGRPKLR